MSIAYSSTSDMFRPEEKNGISDLELEEESIT
jgi:hypothetical protein